MTKSSISISLSIIIAILGFLGSCSPSTSLKTEQRAQESLQGHAQESLLSESHQEVFPTDLRESSIAEATSFLDAHDEKLQTDASPSTESPELQENHPSHLESSLHEIPHETSPPEIPHESSSPTVPTYQQLPQRYKWEPCPSQPFPPQKKEKWLHKTTSLFVTSQGKANHRGRDVLANPLAKVWLIGKFAYGPIDKDLKKEKVATWIRYRCQKWKKINVRLTSTEKQNPKVDLVEDDGGRIFLQHDLQQLGTPPLFAKIRMLVKGDLSSADFYLDTIQPNKKTVVFDIDGTLTTDDKEMFKEIFSGKYTPKMYPNADKIVRIYASKGYQIVYLTGRPDWLTKMTRSWLIKKLFPRGTLHLTDTNSQVLPTKSGVQKYKATFLKFLKKTAHISIFAAYGNATTDIGAYLAAGIPKKKIFIIGKHAGEQGTQKLTSYTKHLPYVLQLPKAP